MDGCAKHVVGDIPVRTNAFAECLPVDDFAVPACEADEETHEVEFDGARHPVACDPQFARLDEPVAQLKAFGKVDGIHGTEGPPPPSEATLAKHRPGENRGSCRQVTAALINPDSAAGLM